MKIIVLLFFVLISFKSQAQNQEIKNSINAFFEGFHIRSRVKMKSVCSENVVLQSISESGKGSSFSEESL